jgi:hypothetical protein
VSGGDEEAKGEADEEKEDDEEARGRRMRREMKGRKMRGKVMGRRMRRRVTLMILSSEIQTKTTKAGFERYNTSRRKGASWL